MIALHQRAPLNTSVLLLLAASTFLSTILICDAFVIPKSPSSSFLAQRCSLRFTPPRQQCRTTNTLSMCICINCKLVTNCAAYHFVEERHEQPHMAEEPGFTPRDGSPTIHVNLRSALTYNADKPNDEIKKLWNEYADQEASADENNGVGQTKYDLSSIGEVSYEYDVVKCEDYMEDMGCWVRHMPKEIRMANPDFVPS